MAKIELEGELSMVECGDFDLPALFLDGEPLNNSLGALTTYIYVGDTYGRCRITIEQIADKSPEAVAKRVVARHRGALDMLGAIDG